MEPRIEQFSRWVPRATMEPITGIRKRLRMARRRVLGGTARCPMTGGTVRCPSPFLTPQGNSRPPLSRTPQALHRYFKKKLFYPKAFYYWLRAVCLAPSFTANASACVSARWYRRLRPSARAPALLAAASCSSALNAACSSSRACGLEDGTEGERCQPTRRMLDLLY